MDKELEISTYQMWKENWLDFFYRNHISDSDGLSFLKEQSIPDQGLKNLIAVWNSVESSFALLDTQFGDKTGEFRTIKRKISELPVLPDNYDFEHKLKVLKNISNHF